MNLAAEAIRIEGSIPVDLPIDPDEQFLFISKDQRALTHALHKYPAKFFPELPRWLIQRYSARGDLILDPFMGSGTTNLEACLLGRHSIGVDVDPFSRFIATVKTTPLPPKQLLPAYHAIRQVATAYPPQPTLEPRPDIPDFPYKDNWFKPYILNELAYLKTGIDELVATQPIKDFFRVCFSSIIRQVSEADDHCTRTVVRKKLAKQVHHGAAIKRFIKRIDTQLENMLAFAALKPRATVTIPPNADARDLTIVADASVDLALTSPPYMNAVDYPRTHQLEIYWLGLANGSLRDLKSQHVGTEVVFAKQYTQRHETGCAAADAAISRIYQSDPRRAFIAVKYLRDMLASLREVYRVLKPGSVYVIVVGNNLVRGVEFETWRYLAEQAPQLGYTVECHFISKIINHFIKVPRQQRINDDHVLVLRK